MLVGGVRLLLLDPCPRQHEVTLWMHVLTNHFTQWQDTIAIRDAMAPTVACTLVEHIFSSFGLPENIHTDQGAQFESDLLASLCKM